MVSVFLIFFKVILVLSSSSFPIFALNLFLLGVTLPVIFSLSTLLEAFEVTVMLLLNLFGLLLGLYFTVMKPVSSGSIDSVDQPGVVQPQEALTLISFSGSSPEFVKVNLCVTVPSSSLITPKSCVS